uniref:splicing factor U2af large subunit B-like isoform X2 n=1 Tax=Scatophagus argus TaxID=75038 RepID=UPI001ED7E5DA|nr:splicing factor U2af large subunit B-like isoform X2 [Scatophagus argus]
MCDLTVCSLFVFIFSGQSKGFDDPSLCPCSSGESSSVPRNMTYGVFQTAKFWEYLIRQKPCDNDRGRSTEHGHNKGRKRGRDMDRESFSFSHNSAEKRMRYRDSMERGHKRHTFERFSGEKEQYRERRQRDKTSSSSNRSTRDNGENRDSQSRRKHNKAKRNRKDKRT